MPGLISFRTRKKRKESPQSDLESQIRSAVQDLSERGFTVRLENLARGHAYRVKSGRCLYVNNRVVFVDKRLPPSQQLSVLREFVDESTTRTHALTK